VEQYLSTHFGYTLEMSRSLPADRWPISVREEKGSLRIFRQFDAVMLRTLGIPSRIVTVPGGEFTTSRASTWYAPATPIPGWRRTFQGRVGSASIPLPRGVCARNGWSRMQLYLDAAASFWREWIINYDASHQRALGRMRPPTAAFSG